MKRIWTIEEMIYATVSGRGGFVFGVTPNTGISLIPEARAEYFFNFYT